MKEAIKNVFLWLKSLILLILSLPFLLVGAIAIALAVLGGLVGVIGLVLLFLGGIVKFDLKNLQKGIEDAVKKAEQL